MGSINLSQSIQEKQAIARGKFFDRGFFINLSILILIAGGYGGSIWYLGKLESELLVLKETLAQKTVSLKDPETDRAVSRAVDIRDRLDSITNNQAVNPDPNSLFLNFEKAVLESIQITEYIRSDIDQAIEISGVTDNLRYLAQQMIALKRIEEVNSIHVDEVMYEEETGKIRFTLNLSITSPATINGDKAKGL